MNDEAREPYPEGDLIDGSTTLVGMAIEDVNQCCENAWAFMARHPGVFTGLTSDMRIAFVNAYVAGCVKHIHSSVLAQALDNLASQVYSHGTMVMSGAGAAARRDASIAELFGKFIPIGDDLAAAVRAALDRDAAAGR
jgi:hypothetical protein